MILQAMMMFKSTRRIDLNPPLLPKYLGRLSRPGLELDPLDTEKFTNANYAASKLLTRTN